MKAFLSLFLVFGIIFNSFSQDFSDTKNREADSLTINYTIQNYSSKIRDAQVSVIVMGGTPPYTYRWSDKNTALNSAIAENLTEGKTYTLSVEDANQQKATTEIYVNAESLDERINSTFIPLVSFFETVLMADVFAALDLYNPVLHDENGDILRHKNGTPMKMKIPFVVVWLVIGAVYFTVRMGFVNIRNFKLAINLVRGCYDNPKHKGEVSHFQALSTALSATVGLGNIAGVAIAIGIGGPGATFWMIIAGLLGMSSKFVECTLGVKYRRIDKDGQVSGGPMYYLSKAFEKRNMKGLGKVLAVLFAILVIGGSLGGGNMFQANQAFSQFSSMIPGSESFGAVFGIVLAILVGIVVIGGIKSIAKVTERIVPFMAVLYVLTALIIIALHIDQTGEAFGQIIGGAFSAPALKGGFIGVMIVGFQRACFSNEAGVGSASIAHSAAKTDEPVSEGTVALLEPFIDTVVICTMTALVIIFTGLHDNPENLQGVELTSSAFGTVFSWFPYLLVVAILLFAFSTMISWSYYGLKGFNFLFGKAFGYKKITPRLEISSLIYYIIFLTFIVVGASSSLGAVVDFSDMMILSMAFPNILGLIVLAPEVKKDLNKYINKIKNGEIKRYK